MWIGCLILELRHTAQHRPTTMLVVILTLFCGPTLSANNDGQCGACANTRPHCRPKIGWHRPLVFWGYFWSANMSACATQDAWCQTARTTHLSVLMTMHNFNTTQNSSHNLPSYHQTTILAHILSTGGEKGYQTWNKNIKFGLLIKRRQSWKWSK